MEYKLNLGDPKTGKTFKKDVKEAEAKVFFGKKMGDKIEGDKIGLEGYEFEICGGSDYCGFPMRNDVVGGARKRILITKGVGNQDNWGGRRRRRTVVGNMISDKITQINLKIIKAGKASLEAPKAEGEAPAEKKAEGKK
ncbi:MAG: 30S ribosomal protein S6e [Nanoarchaeota archaeon]